MSLVNFPTSASSLSSQSEAPSVNIDTKMASVVAKLEIACHAKLQEYRAVSTTVSTLEQKMELEEAEQKTSLALASASRHSAQERLDETRQKGGREVRVVIHKLSPETAANPEKICLIAENFFHGRGVDKDLKTAFRFYEVAAGKGSIEAMYALGCLYLSGQVEEWTSLSTPRGRRWLVKAAEQGHAKSMLKIADIFLAVSEERLHSLRRHMKLIGITKDPEFAPWYYLLKAAKLGLPEAIETLTQLYDTLPVGKIRAIGFRLFEGHGGFEQNQEAAFPFFQAAAKKGCRWSKMMQAFMYLHGVGIGQSQLLSKALCEELFEQPVIGSWEILYGYANDPSSGLPCVINERGETVFFSEDRTPHSTGRVFQFTREQL